MNKEYLVHQISAVIIFSNMTNHPKNFNAFILEFLARFINFTLFTTTDNNPRTIMAQTTSNCKTDSVTLTDNNFSNGLSAWCTKKRKLLIISKTQKSLILT